MCAGGGCHLNRRQSAQVVVEDQLKKKGMEMSDLLDRAKVTVDGLRARRHKLETYEERVQHALDLVYMHFELENPQRIHECIRLYTDDAEWEAPARLVNYRGPEKIRDMYIRLFAATEEFSWTEIERFATPDRVIDDQIAEFRVVREGFENCPVPIGTKVRMRLVHNFHIRDGLISKEIGYEMWHKVGG